MFLSNTTLSLVNRILPYIKLPKGFTCVCVGFSIKPEARRTQADKMKLSVELVKISVEKSVETNSNDKFHSGRLPTIFILKISENLKYFSADFDVCRLQKNISTV